MKIPGKREKISLIFFFILVLCHGITCPIFADTSGTLLIAVYASGGTLEESGLITRDLFQIVKGAENCFSDNCTIIAAYGGADKPGWHGMTIADLDDLKADLSNRILGDDNSFTIHLPGASMGDPKTLQFYLSYLRENHHYTRVFLIFIGHGQAYTGMLFDQNHDDDGLTIGELTTSLEIGPEIELIGFDSCLMGCLEMVSALSPFAHFAITSEESEPAEGWPYKPWISYLGQNPNAKADEHAKELFKNYMNNERQGKTISLLYLKDAGFLTLQLERFAKDLHALAGTDEGCRIIKEALSDTQQFGLTGSGDLSEATMDLYNFAETIKRKVPYISDSADGVIEGINRTVVVARHDERVPGAHGIAVLSPVQINPLFYDYYRESAFITPAWDKFISRYLDKCSEKKDMLPVTSSDINVAEPN
ncbi:MAG: hypothetical protein GXY48_04945 [Methanomicrobiales archaeon]|nr:hypothetical protein [Methanomicrobiales archaeon]